MFAAIADCRELAIGIAHSGKAPVTSRVTSERVHLAAVAIRTRSWTGAGRYGRDFLRALRSERPLLSPGAHPACGKAHAGISSLLAFANRRKFFER